jgi:hypothetical protein
MDMIDILKAAVELNASDMLASLAAIVKEESYQAGEVEIRKRFRRNPEK